MKIISLNEKNKPETSIVERDLRGGTFETAFVLLSKGEYVARVTHKQNLNGKKSPIHVDLEFDSKTFKKTYRFLPQNPCIAKANIFFSEINEAMSTR